MDEPAYLQVYLKQAGLDPRTGSADPFLQERSEMEDPFPEGGW